MPNSLGVIIGRFQVPGLHAGHKELIQYVQSKHEHILFLVGTNTGALGMRNPLPYPVVANMLALETSKLNIQPPRKTIMKIMDHPDDKQWSRNVDFEIDQFCGRMGGPDKGFNVNNVVLYGGRASFIPHYSGIFPTEVYNVADNRDIHISGADIRKRVTACDNEWFWKGMIYAQNQRFPISFQCVDVLVVDSFERPSKVLLGQKAIDGDKWRLPGGFVDTKDDSLEVAARREAREELGAIELSWPQYVGSYRVNDYRYRNSDDKILTTLFVCEYKWGIVRASDDLYNADWHSPVRAEQLIHPIHKDLLKHGLDYLSKASS